MSLSPISPIISLTLGIHPNKRLVAIWRCQKAIEIRLSEGVLSLIEFCGVLQLPLSKAAIKRLRTAVDLSMCSASSSFFRPATNSAGTL